MLSRAANRRNTRFSAVWPDKFVLYWEILTETPQDYYLSKPVSGLANPLSFDLLIGMILVEKGSDHSLNRANAAIRR
jgi:hypothetical protein